MRVKAMFGGKRRAGQASEKKRPVKAARRNKQRYYIIKGSGEVVRDATPSEVHRLRSIKKHYVYKRRCDWSSGLLCCFRQYSPFARYLRDKIKNAENELPASEHTGKLKFRHGAERMCIELGQSIVVEYAHMANVLANSPKCTTLDKHHFEKLRQVRNVPWDRSLNVTRMWYSDIRTRDHKIERTLETSANARNGVVKRSKTSKARTEKETTSTIDDERDATSEKKSSETDEEAESVAADDDDDDEHHESDADDDNDDGEDEEPEEEADKYSGFDSDDAEEAREFFGNDDDVDDDEELESASDVSQDSDDDAPDPAADGDSDDEDKSDDDSEESAFFAKYDSDSEAEAQW